MGPKPASSYPTFRTPTTGPLAKAESETRANKQKGKEQVKWQKKGVGKCPHPGFKPTPSSMPSQSFTSGATLSSSIKCASNKIYMKNTILNGTEWRQHHHRLPQTSKNPFFDTSKIRSSHEHETCSFFHSESYHI